MKRLKAEHDARKANGTVSGGGRKVAVPDLCVMATGGGAYKYYDRIKEALGVEVQREDEMECLIIGAYAAYCLR
jgi:type II pantothenate kinase